MNWYGNNLEGTKPVPTARFDSRGGWDGSASLTVVSALLRSIQRMGNRFERGGPTEQFVASMVLTAVLLAVGGYPTHHVISVDPTGRGDVSETHVRWQKRTRCYVPSPIVVKNFLIVADDRGTANCFDTKTESVIGKAEWDATTAVR